MVENKTQLYTCTQQNGLNPVSKVTKVKMLA